MSFMRQTKAIYLPLCLERIEVGKIPSRRRRPSSIHRSWIGASKQVVIISSAELHSCCRFFIARSAPAIYARHAVGLFFKSFRFVNLKRCLRRAPKQFPPIPSFLLDQHKLSRVIFTPPALEARNCLLFHGKMSIDMHNNPSTRGFSCARIERKK